MKLDTHTLYETYDPEDIGFGIEQLPEQLRLAWHDTREIAIPKKYEGATSIVVAGMGGSALGPHMIASAFADQLAVPFSIIRDYRLPEFVDRSTLVILSSFSGNTEETLEIAHDAIARKAKVMVIAAGGALAKLAAKEGWPAYIFHPGDLAKQPRHGVGFSFGGVLGLLERAGYLKIKDADLIEMIGAMGEVIDSSAADVSTSDNPAKQTAEALVNRSAIILAADHLTGNAHVFSNQINETGKQFAVFAELPEFNHHALEGFRHPHQAMATMTVLSLRSSLYHERVSKRFEVTADLLEDMGIHVIDYVTRGDSVFAELGEVLQFGSYVSWYLALLNGEKTTATPYVDELKKRMVG